MRAEQSKAERSPRKSRRRIGIGFAEVKELAMFLGEDGICVGGGSFIHAIRFVISAGRRKESNNEEASTTGAEGRSTGTGREIRTDPN